MKLKHATLRIGLVGKHSIEGSWFSDKSIPRLEDTMKEQQSRIDVMTQLIRKQTQLEKRVAQKHAEQQRNLQFPDPSLECSPPK